LDYDIQRLQKILHLLVFFGSHCIVKFVEVVVFSLLGFYFIFKLHKPFLPSK
jgi:hypothetical protein